MNRAVVLLSGGLDSATTLYAAKEKGYECSCITFDYGQRHRREIASAKKIAKLSGCDIHVQKIAFPWKGSSLLDESKRIRETHHTQKGVIPLTYVSGRNIVFLSLALSYAEVVHARAIFIGANVMDYSGYPDCRPEFLQSFEAMAASGTKCGVEGKKIKIVAPLVRKTKADIVRLAVKLGVPIKHTWSCYEGKRRPCGKCDSCYYRAHGFKEAGVVDPALFT